MNRSSVILTVLTVVTLLLAGCGVTPGTANASTLAGIPATSAASATSSALAAGKGYVNILVTDAPPKNEVTSIMVTVSSISVHMAGTEITPPPATTSTTTATTTTTTTTATSTAMTTSTTSTATTGTPLPSSGEAGGQWVTISISGPNPFDLLKLQGIDELLGSAQLQAGRYTQIRLEIKKVEVALGGGALQEATLPSGELKFVRPFDVIAGETTDVELDFDAKKSVNVTGNGKVMVKPVVKLSVTNKSSNQLASLSGVVSAVNAQASTITILPTGQTQPVILGVTPQTVIVLDGNEATMAALAALPSGAIAYASYYKSSLKAVRIEIETPQATTTSA